MNDKEPTIANDEVILCVRYTTVVRWVMLLLFAALLAAGIYTLCDCIRHEAYHFALVMAPGCLALYVLLIDNLFVRHILFYRDRVVKVWYGIGRRTIPYSRAQFKMSPAWARRYPGWSQGAKAFQIREVDASGRVPILQVPILYCYLCVAPETRRQVETVVSYLVGIDDRRKIYDVTRSVVRSTLPDDLLNGEEQRREQAFGEDRNRVLEVAELQRLLCGTALAALALWLAGIFFLPVNFALPLMVSSTVAWAVYFVNRLGRALEFGSRRLVLYLIMTASPFLPNIPILMSTMGVFDPQKVPIGMQGGTILALLVTLLMGLIFFLRLISEATTFLRDHEVAVGLLGIGRSELP